MFEKTDAEGGHRQRHKNTNQNTMPPCHRTAVILLLLLTSTRAAPLHVEDCGIIIIGGSVAGISAAIAAAAENISMCLLEPTDW